MVVQEVIDLAQINEEELILSRPDFILCKLNNFGIGVMVIGINLVWNSLLGEPIKNRLSARNPALAIDIFLLDPIEMSKQLWIHQTLKYRPQAEHPPSQFFKDLVTKAIV